MKKLETKEEQKICQKVPLMHCGTNKCIVWKTRNGTCNVMAPYQDKNKQLLPEIVAIVKTITFEHLVLRKGKKEIHSRHRGKAPQTKKERRIRSHNYYMEHQQEKLMKQSDYRAKQRALQKLLGGYMTPLEHNKHLKDSIPDILLIETKHHVLCMETGVWSTETIFSAVNSSNYSFEEEPIIEIQSSAGGTHDKR